MWPIYELNNSGERKVWGTIRGLDAPNRIVFSWHPGRDAESAQEVEVSFRSSNGGTEVTLMHRGWESLGAKALETRAGYEEGWEFVLGKCYAESAAALFTIRDSEQQEG